MKLPKILEIKETGEKLDPGKLAIAGIMISAVVIALITYMKYGYYQTEYSKGAFPDLPDCYLHTLISIAFSILPSALMIVFHLIVKIKNKTSKILLGLLIVSFALLCLNGVVEIVSLVRAYMTENEYRADICYVLLGCHLLSTGSASNGYKILKILPPA